MTALTKKPEGCNPTMELAISAANFQHEQTTLCSLIEPASPSSDRPVTVDYLEGFHSGS